MKALQYYETRADKRFRVEASNLAYDNPSHFHKAVEFHYITKGNYRITIQEQEVSIKRNEILIIPPHQTHFADVQLKTETILVMIPYEFFVYFPALQDTATPFFALRDRDFNRKTILPILRLLVSYFRANEEKPMSNSTTIGWTNLIFGELFSFYTLNFAAPRNTSSDFSKNILSYIDEHYGDPSLSLPTIAQAFNYNPSYLSRIFKDLFFVPLNQYIRSLRIQKFIALYAFQSEPNILNLAFDCGFSSLAAFYRAFHKETGCSPKEYFKPHS